MTDAAAMNEPAPPADLSTAMPPPRRRSRDATAAAMGPVSGPGEAARKTPADPPGRGGRRIAGWALLAVALPLATWVVVSGWHLLRVDFGTLQARQLAAQCGNVGKSWTDPVWRGAEADLLWGAALAPQDAVLQDGLAQLYACEGTLLWADEAARAYPFAVARGHYEASLRLRPDHGPTLAGLATAILGSAGSLPEYQQAWEQALAHGPHEAAVQVALFELALRTWGQATPTMKTWVLTQYAAASPEAQKRLLALADKLGQRAALP